MLKQNAVLYFLIVTSLVVYSQQKDTALVNYLNTISNVDLKKHLEVLASDAYEGRATGERGQKLAAHYLASYFESIGAKKLENNSYLQPFVVYRDSLTEKKKKNITQDINTENVIAIIEGNELKNECIVISAHYDHLGTKRVRKQETTASPLEHEKTVETEELVVFNGADDDGSGTVALLEIAEAFMLAKNNNKGPRRTIIIAAFTGEEIGLCGSKHYVNNPAIAIDSTVANLNIDMIGRVDNKHKDASNYLYLIGSEKISSELKNINEKNNKLYANLALDYSYDTNDEYSYYYRSDHYNFAKNNVPIVFYFNGTHEDYHKETDDVDKINFDLLEARTQLIFSTAWELANRDKRIIKDKLQKHE